jgi:hypothetical protein
MWYVCPIKILFSENLFMHSTYSTFVCQRVLSFGSSAIWQIQRIVKRKENARWLTPWERMWLTYSRTTPGWFTDLPYANKVASPFSILFSPFYIQLNFLSLFLKPCLFFHLSLSLSFFSVHKPSFLSLFLYFSHSFSFIVKVSMCAKLSRLNSACVVFALVCSCFSCFARNSILFYDIFFLVFILYECIHYFLLQSITINCPKLIVASNERFSKTSSYCDKVLWIKSTNINPDNVSFERRSKH